MRGVAAVLLLVGTAPAMAAMAGALRFGYCDAFAPDFTTKAFSPFVRALSSASGLDLVIFESTDRRQVLEAMLSGKVAVALCGPAEYVVLRANMPNLRLIAAATRIDYFSSLVVLQSSAYHTLVDLRGRRVGFGGEGSTSTHLGAAKVLADAGLLPGSAYAFIHFPVRSEGFLSLIDGRIDALALAHEHLRTFRERYPDVPVRVVGRGFDLPPDVLIAAPDLPPRDTARLVKALSGNASELHEALTETEENRKYAGGVLTADVSDREFNTVRDMYRVIRRRTFTEFVGR